MVETTKLYVPADAAALSVGADGVASALLVEAARQDLSIEICRNGSRGMLWLEPLIEVEQDGIRHGFASVTPEDATSLIQAVASGALSQHSAYIGDVNAHEFLAGQKRITFARCGVIDPLDIDDYERHGGLEGMRKAVALSPSQIISIVTESGLRGRGGAGFPAGIKWNTVLQQDVEQKYVCCNADEGDSGTFADRMLMEGDPFSLLEGMVITAMACGATVGYIYLRSEYPDAINVVGRAIERWRERGLLGSDILGSGRSFDINLRRGAGAYICGEESSMLESLEGKRGEVRAKPPIPAISGLFSRPTVVNNVLTLASVPMILSGGAEQYRDLGVGRSSGTQAFQLAGNIARGGLVEVPFGISLRDLIESYGGGTLSGRPVRAVQVGGPLGSYLPAEQLDVAMTYEAMAEIGAMLGHGGIVVFDDTVDMAEMAEFAMKFCAEESCGKCTPCRIGAVRGAETIAKIRQNQNVEANISLVEDLCELMVDGSMCAMGGLTPNPVLSALKHFRGDFITSNPNVR